MNIQELLKWTDEQVYEKTGKHLDTLQKRILEGTFMRQKYPRIASHNNPYKHDYIKEQGAKLWKLLSEVFEEEGIKQSNVRSILENQASSTINNYGNCPLFITNQNIKKNQVNICPEKRKCLENRETLYYSKETLIIDLTEAPEIEYDIDRPSEISTIKNWLENKTKLITIYGLSEIGKTALILQLIPEIKEQFDYIIYRSFNYKKRTFETIKTEIKQILDQKKTENKLIDYFQSSRCLLIIDNLESIFKTGELSGEYLTEYKDYNNFFKQIAHNNHQSCVILISWEQPKEINKQQTLHLKGLNEEAKELLRKKDLKDEEKWTELITLYQGHPTWLNNIADTINDYYNGKVSLFLSEHSELFLDDLETIITPHFDRLSELEKKALNWLANQNEPINIITREFLAAIKSLRRRGLVEKKNSHFIINPVFKAYCRVGNCSD